MKVSRSDRETIVWQQGIGMVQRGSLVAKGQMTDGCFTGKAIIKTANEFFYRGECVNDAFEGCGTLVSQLKGFSTSNIPIMVPSSGVASFTGYFHSSQKQGFGIATWCDGSIRATWHKNIPNGFVQAESADESFEGLISGQVGVGKKKDSQGKYHGQFRKGKRFGVGIFKTSNSHYVGSWEDDQAHGFGEEVQENGTRYEGEWKNGVLNGIGRVTTVGTSASKDWKAIYIGNYELGKRTGFGKVDQNDMTYVGSWKNSMKHGKGHVIMRQSNSSYFGDWHEDKRQGIGVSFTEGIQYLGEWKSDKPHGVGIIIQEGRRETLVVFSEGIVKEQLDDDQIGSYRKKFSNLDLTEFNSNADYAIASFQRKLESSLMAMKMAFKDLQLDYTAEKEEMSQKIETLSKDISSVDKGIEVIEAFFDKRCLNSGIKPLTISQDLKTSESIKMIKETVELEKSSKRISQIKTKDPVQVQDKESSQKKEDENFHKLLASPKKLSMTPEKQMTIEERFTKNSSIKKSMTMQLSSPSERENHRKNEIEDRGKQIHMKQLKEELVRKMNQVDLKESSLNREIIQFRKSKDVLFKMEDDLNKREKELEQQKRKVTLEKLAIEDQKIHLSIQENKINHLMSEKNYIQNIHDIQELQTHEAIARQKQILKQLEQMVDQEKARLDSIKLSIEEESKKAVVESKNNPEKKDQVKSPKKTHEPSQNKITQTEFVKENEVSHTKCELKLFSFPAYSKANVLKLVAHKELQTEDVYKPPSPPCPKSLSDDDVGNYFDKLHLKTKDKGNKFNLEDDDDAVQLLKEGGDGHSKTEDAINRYEKDLHLEAKNEVHANAEHFEKIEKLEEELKSLKAEFKNLDEEKKQLNEKLIQLQSQKVEPSEVKSNANLGVSLYQSGNLAAKKDQLIGDQQHALQAAVDTHKRLELRASYLEQQIEKSRKKDQHKAKVVQDYTKMLTDWLSSLQHVEALPPSTDKPASIDNLKIEISEGLLSSIPKAEQIVKSSKESAGRFLYY
jgi:hypothetical protein